MKENAESRKVSNIVNDKKLSSGNEKNGNQVKNVNFIKITQKQNIEKSLKYYNNLEKNVNVHKIKLNSIYNAIKTT